MAKLFGLGKQERLKSRKQIDALFTGGKSFPVFPLRVTYSLLTNAEEPGAQVGVTVSKRHFKRAVDRNLIKRLLREAYRLQKNEFVESLKNKKVKASVFFMFTGKTLPTFNEIKPAMQTGIEKLQQRLGTINENHS